MTPRSRSPSSPPPVIYNGRICWMFPLQFAKSKSQTLQIAAPGADGADCHLQGDHSSGSASPRQNLYQAPPYPVPSIILGVWAPSGSRVCLLPWLYLASSDVTGVTWGHSITGSSHWSDTAIISGFFCRIHRERICSDHIISHSLSLPGLWRRSQ